MIFRKKIEKSCLYCAYGAKMDDDEILCIKKGIVSCVGKCRKFRYDPCKRTPSKRKPLDFNKYSQEDFSL